MAKQISILEKFSETVKGIADSASQALKSEEPSRVDETAAVYMPFAAEGLVSDALPVPAAAARGQARKEIHGKEIDPESRSQVGECQVEADRKDSEKESRRQEGGPEARPPIARVNDHEIMTTDDY
jgi:hypothetical protein